MATKQIDEKYLKGLKFSGSEEKKVKVDRVEKKRYFPFERDLKPSDVLDWVDKGDTVVIVTADGQKHKVRKSGSGEAGKSGSKDKEGSK